MIFTRNLLVVCLS